MTTLWTIGLVWSLKASRQVLWKQHLEQVTSGFTSESGTRGHLGTCCCLWAASRDWASEVTDSRAHHTWPMGGQGWTLGANYQLQDGQVTFPPHAPAHPRSQAGQGIVAIHEDVDKGVQHPNKEGWGVKRWGWTRHTTHSRLTLWKAHSHHDDASKIHHIHPCAWTFHPGSAVEACQLLPSFSI